MLTFNFDKQKFNAELSGLTNMTENIGKRLYQATVDSLLDVHGTAVLPGYAPYKTGNLRRSLTYKAVKAVGFIVGFLGTNVEYGRIQEFGGDAGRNHATHIKGKLYLTRAIAKNKEAIKDRFRRYLAVKNT